jgi:hypothetical protein
MKKLKDRISDVSSCLQSLMTPDVFPKVQEAVEKEDKESLMRVCKKAKVPDRYLGAVVSVIMSVNPEIKYPALF